MAEQDPEARRWVVEPPGPGEVSLHFVAGEGVELTAEQETALGSLLESLEANDPEVTGHAGGCPALVVRCPSLGCSGVSCGALRCGTLGSGTCTREAASWSLGGSFTVQ